MSTVVASYTPVRRSPVLPASSGTTPARHSWRPAAAFPTSMAVGRPPLSVTRALPEKQRPAFSIPPTALLYPVPPPDGKERWDIKEEKDHVKLWFQVPGLSEQDLEITTDDDMLEIKRKGAGDGDVYDEARTKVHGVGSFHVRLLMTKEYDSSNITAELKAGMLEVTVGKSENRHINTVEFGPRSPAQTSKSPVQETSPARTRENNPNEIQHNSVQKTGTNQAQGAQDGAGQYKNSNGPAQTKSPKEENGSR